MSTTWFKLTLLLLLVGTCFAASPPVEYNQPPTFAFIGGRFVVIPHPQVTQPSRGLTLTSLNTITGCTWDGVGGANCPGNITANSFISPAGQPWLFTCIADPGVPVAGNFWCSTTTPGTFKYADNNAVIQSVTKNPMTTAGDIITAGASGVPTRLAMGLGLQVLRVNAGGTALEYAAAAGGSTLIDYQKAAAAITMPQNVETTVYTTTVAGGTMAAGSCIAGDLMYQHSTGTDSTTYKLYYGTLAFTVFSGSGSTNIHHITFKVCNDPGVTNSQQFTVTLWQIASNQVLDLGSFSSANPQTGAIDSTASQVVKFTATQATATLNKVTPILWNLNKS